MYVNTGVPLLLATQSSGRRSESRVKVRTKCRVRTLANHASSNFCVVQSHTPLISRSCLLQAPTSYGACRSLSPICTMGLCGPAHLPDVRHQDRPLLRTGEEDNAGSLARCGQPPLSSIDTLVLESTVPLEGHHAPLTSRLGLGFELNDLETPRHHASITLSSSSQPQRTPLPLRLAALCGSTGVGGCRWNALTKLEVTVLEIELDQGVRRQSISNRAAGGALVEKTVRQLSTDGALKPSLLRGEHVREANVSVLEHFCTVEFAVWGVMPTTCCTSQCTLLSRNDLLLLTMYRVQYKGM